MINLFEQVTGSATEEQIILAVQTYIDRPQLLTKALNNLFHIFRFSECCEQNQALHVNSLFYNLLMF